MKTDRLTSLIRRSNNLSDFWSPDFKLGFSTLKRSHLCVLLAVLSVPSFVLAAPIRLDARDNRLGSATAFGHARYVQPLGEFSIGSVNYPVNLIFNSNPADAPGAFGPYWRIPLFASTVVLFSQYKLYWDGPDERRKFFVLDHSHDSKRGEQVFIERGQRWKATLSPRGEILVEALNEPGWAFRYLDGRLETFRLGTAADACRISWSGRGLPLYITNQATNRRIFEIQYRGATDPQRILMGEQQFAISMGDGEHTAPDGISNYRNYRVSFLRSLTIDDGEEKSFAYSKANTRQRRVTLLDQARRSTVKNLDLAVNRMEITSVTDQGDGNWIEWEAKSGFLTADSGSRYEVTNNGWDPNVEANTFDVTPASVEIKRFPHGGRQQLWSYDWSSGVRIYTDLATGEVYRRTSIMAEGPAMGKLRQQEVLKDGKWTLVRRNSYDPRGRLIRSTQGDSLRILEWVKVDGNTSKVTHYLNGLLDRVETIGKNGSIIYRETYKRDGLIEFFRTEVKTGQRIDYFVTIDSSGQTLRQSIMIDRETVFLVNKHGAFKFAYDKLGERSPKLLSSSDPRFLLFNDLLSEAFSL